MSEWLPSSRTSAATPWAMTSPGARIDASASARRSSPRRSHPCMRSAWTASGCGAPLVGAAAVHRHDVDAKLPRLARIPRERVRVRLAVRLTRHRPLSHMRRSVVPNAGGSR